MAIANDNARIYRLQLAKVQEAQARDCVGNQAQVSIVFFQ